FRLRLDSCGAIAWNVGPVVGLDVVLVGSSITVSSTVILAGSALARSTVFSAARPLAFVRVVFSARSFAGLPPAAGSGAGRDTADCESACVDFASREVTAGGLVFSAGG